MGMLLESSSPFETLSQVSSCRQIRLLEILREPPSDAPILHYFPLTRSN
jgi:hypothetical protein